MDRMKTCSGSISATRSSTRAIAQNTISYDRSHASQSSHVRRITSIFRPTTMHMLSFDMCMRTVPARYRSAEVPIHIIIPRQHSSDATHRHSLNHRCSHSRQKTRARYQPHASLQSLPCPSQNTPALLAPAPAPNGLSVGQPAVPWTTKHSRRGAQENIYRSRNRDQSSIKLPCAISPRRRV